jgi:hypothetical protein
LLCTQIPNCPCVSGPPIKVTPQVLPAVLMAIWSRESKAFAVIAASAGASAATSGESVNGAGACPVLARQVLLDRPSRAYPEHRAPHGLPPGEVAALSAGATQVQPGGQAGHAGDLRPAGPVELHGDRVFVRVAGQPAVQEGRDHVLFPRVPVVAGQQPQHPPVPLLRVQAAAHPAASAPVRPSLARTTRAVAARSSASAASARRPFRVSRK